MSTPWIVAFVALWALVLVLALLVLGTLRRLVPLIERLEEETPPVSADALPRGLAAGTHVPEFEAERADGGVFASSDLVGSPSFVLFLGEKCPACARFNRDLRRATVPALDAQLVVVVETASLAREFARVEGVSVLLQTAREIADVFDSNVTPHAFALDSESRVLASGTPNDWARLRRLRDAAAKGGGQEVDLVAAAS